MLALPRGGVPVAFEVAKALDAEMDLLFVRKIGAPGYASLGWVQWSTVPIRSSCSTKTSCELAPNADYVRMEMQRQLAEIERRRKPTRAIGRRWRSPDAW